MTLAELQNKVVTGRARLDIAKSKESEARDKLLELTDLLDTRRKALALLQSVASQTQEQLKQAVESAVNSSIEMLFPGYSFLVNFVPKNNKVVAELKIKKGTTELDPVASTGGGVVDAISFSLRAGCLMLAGKRPILILDEPFKHVRGEPRQDLGKVLSTLVDTMGVQVLMVSDVAGTDINASTEYSF